MRINTKILYYFFTYLTFLTTVALSASAQTTLYSEDFTQNSGKGQDGTTLDTTGISNWTMDVANGSFSSGDWFKVTNGYLESEDTDASSATPVVWFSPAINIQCQDVSVYTDLGRAYSNSSSGCKALYRSHDGGVWSSWTSFGVKEGSDGTEDFETFSATGISGDSVQVKVEHWGSSSTPNYRHDNVKVKGTALPSTPASAVSISNNTGTSLDLSWTNGNGDKVLVVAKETANALVDPQNETSYSASTVFTSGDETETGSENYVVYDGTGTTVSVSGLTSGTDYDFTVYTYSSACPCYNPDEAFVSTYCTSPTTSPSSFAGNNVAYSTLDLSWTNGNGDQTLITGRRSDSGHVDPLMGVSYSSNTAFGQGDEIGSGNFVLYNGTGTSFTVTALAPGTEYVFSAYTFNSASNCYNMEESRVVVSTDNTSVYEIDLFDGAHIITSSGTFTHSQEGSFDDYDNNEDYTITFEAPDDKLLRFDFTNGEIDQSDYLEIYNGPSTSDPLMVSVSGSSSSDYLDYFGGGPSFDFLSPKSSITFRFVSDGSTTADGWSADISVVERISQNSNPDMSDLFGGAEYVCNFNGYYGRTRVEQGEDLPGDLDGAGGTCPTLFGGTIENNAWLKFEAGATSVDFNFEVTTCSSGDGIQVAVFDYDGSSFTRKSDCSWSDGEHNGTFTVTASSLTVGETYYIMVDGNAGAICDYEINAPNASELITVDAGTDQTICEGDLVDLSADAAGGSQTFEWTWSEGGGGSATGQTLSDLSPTETTNYQVSVDGPCSNASDVVTVTVNDCSLPVELLEFNCRKDKHRVRINWITASETNNDFFVVQRSSDGYTFNDLMRIDGAGNSVEMHEYLKYDNKPLDGDNYYRIKQVDFDGSLSNTYPVHVYYDDMNQSSSMKWYPSESKLEIHLNENSGNVTLSLYDSTGRRLMQKNIAKGIRYQVENLCKYSHGSQMLIISLTGKHISEQKKIILRR